MVWLSHEVVGRVITRMNQHVYNSAHLTFVFLVTSISFNIWYKKTVSTTSGIKRQFLSFTD